MQAAPALKRARPFSGLCSSIRCPRLSAPHDAPVLTHRYKHFIVGPRHEPRVYVVEPSAFAEHIAAVEAQGIQLRSWAELGMDDPNVKRQSYELYRAVWDPWPSALALQTFLDNLDLPGARDVRADQLIDDRLLKELQSSGWLAHHLGPP